MKVLIAGATGMLGSMVLDVFDKNTSYELIPTARVESDFNDKFNWRKLDARKYSLEEIKKIANDCDRVINCIGIIKPYIHDDNSFEVQRALEVNSLFPHKLAQAAEACGAKVIQIATDCVYDGEKGNYIETDKHNALDVYGKSKSMGEVYSSNLMNLRCSIIGPEKRGKSSLLEWFLNQPENAQVNGFLNHLWNGVTTYHFAKICLGIIENNIEHFQMQHVVPKDSVTKAQMLKDFAQIYGRNDIQITDINANVGVDRTVSTTNKEQNQKIWELAGYSEIPTVREMVEELKNVRI